VKSGNFYWNAGMFFWRASVLLDALREFLPKTATLLASLPAFANRRFSIATEGSFFRTARTFRSTTRCSKKLAAWWVSRPAILAGTMSVAGTRYMNCCLGMQAPM